MTKSCSWLTLLSALLLFAGCGPANVSQLTREKNASQLSPEEVLELVEGNTLFLEAFGEHAYYFFDGSGTLFAEDIDNNEDSGRWDVSNNGEVCMKLEWWWYGDLRCFPVYSGSGGKYYLVSSNGVVQYKADQFTGDHKNLYHATEDSGRKSYRRSVRSTMPAEKQTAVQSPPAPQPDETVDLLVPPASDQELRTTVKWMARDCPGCNLAKTNLRKADLVGAGLQGANLAGADLGMANLRRADLQGANLEGADLSYANLPGADLRNAVLVNTDLRGANLIRADLTGADIRGADFTDALVEGAVGLE